MVLFPHLKGLQGTGKSTLLILLAKAMPECQVYREGDISPVELAWCSYMTEKQFQETLEKYPQLEEEIRKRTMCEGRSGAGNPSVASAGEECHAAVRTGDIQIKNAADTLRYITAYTLILAEQRGFYEYMEQYEIYNGRVSFEVFHGTIMKRYAAYTGEQSIFECSFFQNSTECMMLYYQMTEEELVFSHGDYCLPNVFAKNGHISGFLDLGNAGVSDKWHDIALCYRSLMHNADGTYGGKMYPGYEQEPSKLFEKLGMEPDWKKIRYYILLDELF